MAKRQTVVLETNGDEEDKTRQEEEFEQANEDTDGELLRSLQEMAGTAGVTFLFTRTYPNTPDSLGFVGEMTPAEFSLEQVQRTFGAGHYRVRVKGPKGFMPGGGTIRVARGPASNAAPGAASSSVSDIAALLKALKGDEDARAKEAADRRHQIMTLTIPAAITTLGTVLGALLDRNTGPDIAGLITALKPAPGPTLTDLTNVVSNIKNLTGPEKSDSNVETIFKVLELAKETLGGDGKAGESNWVDIVRDLLKAGPDLVKPILEAARNPTPPQVPVPMQVRPIPPPSATIQDTGSAATSSMENSSAHGDDDVNAFAMPIIRQQLEKLLQWAVEKKRPELYAEVFLEEVPAIVHQYVTPEQALTALQRPDWLAQITAIDARLSPHADWLNAVREELIDILKDQLREKRRASTPPDQIVDHDLNGNEP